MSVDFKLFKENPFTDAYVAQELAWYAGEPYEKDGLEIQMKKPTGHILMDYFNKRFRIMEEEIPVLFLDNHLWMSLTPMEIQSASYPTLVACGRCATAGGGLGYAALKMAQDEDVDSVDVYERDPRIIEYITHHLGQREGFKKLHFILGDVRKEMRKKQYDYVWMDIYDTMLPDIIVKDIKHFRKHNDIEEYRFWGLERVLLDAMYLDMNIPITYSEREFISEWHNTEFEEREGWKLHQLYDNGICGKKYIRAVMKALGRW